MMSKHLFLLPGGGYGTWAHTDLLAHYLQSDTESLLWIRKCDPPGTTL